MNKIESNKMNLLISEDDFENKVFLDVLLNQHFNVFICDSAETFYEYLGSNKFDVILMDISIFGEKNGLQLTKEIKNSPLYKHIPVVCYTAHARQQDRINAFEAGCDYYLAKPVENETLVNTLIEAAKKGIN
jgi:CheY-like chemotaxis protein